jgi:5-methylcytosine-specific restriction endonuclease McrA
VRRLADGVLLCRLRELVLRSAALTAAVLVHLGEVDARGLHLGEGYSSLFAYCTGALGLSESAAYKRIQAARLCRRLPAVLGAVQSGRIHLSGLCVLAPHLDEHNHRQALDAAAGRSKRDIEILAERLRPTPVPAPAPSSPEPAPGQVGLDLVTTAARTEPAATETIAPPVRPPARPQDAAPSSERTRTERRVSLVATVRLEGLLDRARALLAHTEGGADTTAVVERALDLLVTTLEKKRFGIGARPRRAKPASTDTRGETADVVVTAVRPTLPVALRRAVYERDGGRCTFVAPSGHRCGETRGLELHHRTPWAVGGPDALDNLTLHCRPHNGLLARRDLGDDVIAARIRDRRGR